MILFILRYVIEDLVDLLFCIFANYRHLYDFKNVFFLNFEKMVEFKFWVDWIDWVDSKKGRSICVQTTQKLILPKIDYFFVKNIKIQYRI